jgi:hypothetical protein
MYHIKLSKYDMLNEFKLHQGMPPIYAREKKQTKQKQILKERKEKGVEL